MIKVYERKAIHAHTIQIARKTMVTCITSTEHERLLEHLATHAICRLGGVAVQRSRARNPMD